MSKSNYEDLLVFKKSHEIVIDICTLLENFPKEQKFMLYSQLFRSVTSVPANIAEGFGRNSTPQTIYHLNVSIGSAEEAKYHILLAKDLKFISDEEYTRNYSNLHEVVRMLNGLINSLNKK